MCGATRYQLSWCDGRCVQGPGTYSPQYADQVVFCRVYTPSAENWGPINEEYAAFFGEHKPGRVVVSTTDLHFGCLVEIEAIAELED